MNYFDEMYTNYTEEEWLEGMLENQFKEWSEKANTNRVSLVEWVSAHHKAIVYELALNAVVSERVERVTPKETKDYIVNARRALLTFLTKELDGVTIVEKELKNSFGYSHKVLSSNNKLKYVGKPDHHAWELGEVYSIIEVSNWFHNSNELGYYLTTDEYDGDDIDYGCFYPMGTLGEDFEVLNG